MSSTNWIDTLYNISRPLLFSLPAEQAHRLGLFLLRITGASGLPRWTPPGVLSQRLLGLTFSSPVGLAAGFDKDARCLAAWSRIGFGFAEVGTVTPRQQAGNPRPRLFRMHQEQSLQNWMGFNGRGVEYMANKLRKRPVSFPLGVNVGKNADTPLSHAVDDYELCARKTGDRCDFLVANVSSPNTPGLRTLQRSRELAKLVGSVVAAADPKPVLVKLSPDEEIPTLCELAVTSVDQGASGIVLCNTSVDYSLSNDETLAHKGGLSGRIIQGRSRFLTRKIGAALAGRGILVSVGGIDSAEEAYRRLKLGAHLIELYTGLVYGGPSLPRRIAEGVAEQADRDGVSSIGDVVGVDL